jgi:hypothetical protein
VRVPPESFTAIKVPPFGGAPVARFESTTVLLSIAAAYTAWLESELIDCTKLWIDSPAATVTGLPSIVRESALAGLANVNVRCDEFGCSSAVA